MQFAMLVSLSWVSNLGKKAWRTEAVSAFETSGVVVT